MKFKLKVNKDTFVNLFLYQSGPMILGVGAIVFLLLCWGAMGRESYEKTPQDLLSAAQRADDHIEQTKPDEIDIAPPPDYEAWVEKNSDPIRVDAYALQTPWDNKIFRQKVKRTEPKLLTVRELRGTASVGAVAMRDEQEQPGGATGRRGAGPGGAGPGMMPGGMEGGMAGGMGSSQQGKGQRWIVLTGLVPVSEQEKAFDECFQEALNYNPNRDYPEYMYYDVERARVNPNNPGEELKWQKVDLKKMLEVRRYWMSMTQPRVLQIYRHERLTFSLPPLVGRNWDESIAHVPDIPLAENEEFTPAETEEAEEGKAEETEKAAEGEEDPFGRFSRRRGGMGGMGMGPGMGMEGGGMRGGGRRRSRGGMGGMGMGPGMEGGMGMPGGEGGMMGPGMGPGMEGGMGMGMGGMYQKETPYYLYRFFDFDVEPGAHYRYRVRLALLNPNYELEPKYLQSPDLAKDSYIKSEWSEPSEIVSVPLDDRLMLASVNAGRRPSDEPKATLFAVHWDKETGQEIFKEFPVQLGQWTEFEMERRKANPMAPGGMGMGMGMEGGMGMGPGMEGGMGMGPGMEGGGPGMMPGGRQPGRGRRGSRPRQPLSEKVACNADELVLDITGGEKLPGRGGMIAPGEILLMTADGVLKVRNDMDDEDDIREQKKPRELVPGRGGMGPMMGPGMEGGGRRGGPGRMPARRGGGGDS